MRRALASIRFSPADTPRPASRPARSRTTSRLNQVPGRQLLQVRLVPQRPIAFILAATEHRYTPQPISRLPGEPFPGTSSFQDDSDRTYCHAACSAPGVRVPASAFTAAGQAEAWRTYDTRPCVMRDSCHRRRWPMPAMLSAAAMTKKSNPRATARTCGIMTFAHAKRCRKLQ